MFVQAQNVKIGEWNSHLNYSSGKKCEEVKDKIYCSTASGLFYVNKADNSMIKLSKIDGFSDTEVQTMEYDSDNDALLIAYTNTFIDILKGNKIYSIPDIFRKSMTGKKILHHIYFNNNLAYISGSFGIVVYNISKNEIKESFTEIGANGSPVEVFATAIFNDSIFAASASGILAASLKSQNLLNYKEWSLVNTKSCNKIVDFTQSLFADIDGLIHRYVNGKWTVLVDSMKGKCNNLQVTNNVLTIDFENCILIIDKDLKTDVLKAGGSLSSLVDKENRLWFTSSQYGLLSSKDSKFNFYTPNGPFSGRNWSISISDNTAFVAPGGYNVIGTPTYFKDGYYIYKNGSWTNINFTNEPNLSEIYDIVKIAVDPQNKDVYIGSYGNGLVVFRNNAFLKIYDDKNSSLQGTVDNPDKILITGMKFDNKNRLWVTNTGAEKPISVKNTDGKWMSYSLGSSKHRRTGNFVIDNSGRKWILLPFDAGLIVFDETRTSGNQYILLTKAENNGNLPTDRIHSIASDKKGRIWIGSEEGVAVFYNPADVFSQKGVSANRIWINQNGESGYLLASEIVTVITVDGANKKWLGSRNGVWYVNEDGSEIIYHFNTENSPLPSNFIRDITVNDLTGEVFFATDKGIVSFRNYAVGAGSTHTDVFAYPNPVEPDYQGPVAIKGLVYNANVKITDVAGNIVTQLTAEGGQAIWNLKDISGREVKSGVYLVFSSNDDGSETMVTKILIVR